MKLLQPLHVGSVTLRNRVVFGPHETNLARGRAFSDRHVAYYRRRARGGAALIVTEHASVHESDWPYERCPSADEADDGWREIARACHDEGAAVIAGLSHSGLQGSSAFHQRELWAPSRVPDAITRELPKQMDSDDIAAVIDGFAAAAAAAMAAGLDGVEINAGQHSLVRQFLSGLTNTRDDEWGPDDETGRLRFATEVLDRVRAAIGVGVVGLRLSCDELAPWAGLTPEMAAEVAVALAPQVDYLVVERGSIFSVDATRPDTHVEPGFNLGLAETIHDAAAGATAVVAQGSIVDPAQAEWALDDGRAELVEMTRAQIAEPDLVAKLHAEGAVRPCLLCNQKCRVRDNRNPIVSCTVNPTAGFELDEVEQAPTVASPERIIVIGAGPAGLECARVAATAGHIVTVIDQAAEAGGRVRDFAAAAGRDRLAVIIDWLLAECGRLGVPIDLNTPVTDTDVAGWLAEGRRVVFCTGSVAGPREFETEAGANVLDAATLLADLRRDQLMLRDGPLVIWDPVGGPIAISIAETLAHRGDVTLVTPDVNAGTMLSLTGDLAAASTRLHQAGVTIARRRVLRIVRPGAVEIEDRFTGTREHLPAATLIDASTRRPDTDLWRSAGTHHLRAGDAVAPRTIFEAMLEGRRVANSLATSATPTAAGVR